MTASNKAVTRAIEDRRTVVNDAIGTDLPVTDPTRLYSAARHLLDAGGKRLRPVVSLIVAEALCGTDGTDADYRSFPTLRDGESPIDLMSAAVSIEVIQSFTLIHDDIMDDDDLRRGAASVHREYDLETAILAGDTLYSKGFEFMLESGAPPERSVRAMRTLARACTNICEGQAMDIAFESRENVSIAEYLRMIERKTAVLYAAAASIPAILVGADDVTVDALYDYGLDMGRGFQVQDDLLDLTTPSEQLGKQQGSDLAEGKRTLMTLHAREQGVDLDRLLGAENESAEHEPEHVATPAQLETTLERLEAAGSIEYARNTADSFVRSSKQNLAVVPDGNGRDLLAGIAEFLVERGY